LGKLLSRFELQITNVISKLYNLCFYQYPDKKEVKPKLVAIAMTDTVKLVNELQQIWNWNFTEKRSIFELQL